MEDTSDHTGPADITRECFRWEGTRVFSPRFRGVAYNAVKSGGDAGWEQIRLACKSVLTRDPMCFLLERPGQNVRLDSHHHAMQVHVS